MAGTATPIFPQTIRGASAQILNADGTTKKTLCAGGTNGTRIDAISVASTDTAARDLQLWMNNGSVDQLLCTVSIPINSGNANNVAAVDLLRSSFGPMLAYDANGNRVLYVPNGYTLKVAAATSVTATKQLDVLATAAGDY